MTTTRNTVRRWPGRGRPVSIADIIITTLILVAIVFAILWLIEWLNDDDAIAGANVGVTLDEVTDDPEEFYGERVVVSGDVQEALGPRAFTIGPEELLIIAATPLDQLPGATGDGIEGALAQVSGTVKPFVLKDAEAELGIDLDDDMLLDFEDQAVIVASSALLNRRAVEAKPSVNAGAFPPDEALPISEIAGELEKYAGQEITVVGEVSRVVGMNGFVFEGLAYDTDDVIVFTKQEIPATFPASVPALLTGTVRSFDTAAIEAELGVDLEDNLVDGYEADYVLLATKASYFPRFNGIADDPLDFVGATVTVRHEVDEVLSPTAFTIAGGDVLVLANQPTNVIGEATAIATGTMAIFDLDRVESDFGIDLDDGLFDDDEWDSRPVLIAESVEIVR